MPYLANYTLFENEAYMKFIAANLLYNFHVKISFNFNENCHKPIKKDKDDDEKSIKSEQSAAGASEKSSQSMVSGKSAQSAASQRFFLV